MVKFFKPRSWFVIRPLLPKSKITERVREKGGEMTGMVARVPISFLCLTPVRSTRKAKIKPMIVETEAVMIPSLVEPQRA